MLIVVLLIVCCLLINVVYSLRQSIYAVLFSKHFVSFWASSQTQLGLSPWTPLGDFSQFAPPPLEKNPAGAHAHHIHAGVKLVSRSHAFPIPSQSQH